MRIAVLGATGRTGGLLVDRALERGMDVVALVRHDPDPPLDASVTVTLLDLRDQDAIAPALAGADAVVSAIGPVAGVTRTEISETTQAVVDAMVRTGVRRIVAAANGTVLTDKRDHRGVRERRGRTSARCRDPARQRA